MTKELRVGIATCPVMRVTLDGVFVTDGDNRTYGPGQYTVTAGADSMLPTGRMLTPTSARAAFEVEDVTIGINFHWQRRERQRFGGRLTLQPVATGILAINTVDVEQYLESVISSEMSARASLEFLKAHAVISRSWVLAQLEPHAAAQVPQPEPTGTRVMRWYDRSDHDLYDVCADDHCQRYQGIGRVVSSHAPEVVRLTCGEVLEDRGGALVDARFSKCCGGVTERFDTCWSGDIDPACLQPVADIEPQSALPDLTDEAEAARWISGRPEAFCSSVSPEVLDQVLNDYDRPTTDFYRWQVVYTPEELTSLIACRSGIDFGLVTALTPLRRGASGRIELLRIEGTRRTVDVGKELEIRRWLSPTHLKSSAFIAGRDTTGRFVLTGAGWGHGVGLCQIGAAAMATFGYDYRSILAHYYPGSHVRRRY